MLVEKSWIICRKISRNLNISLRDSYAASVKEERLFSQSEESLQETTSFNLFSFAAPFAQRPKVEDGQSSRPKYIKIMHLVFCEAIDHWRCLI